MAAKKLSLHSPAMSLIIVRMGIVRMQNVAGLLLASILGVGCAAVESATVTNHSAFSVGYGFVEGKWSTQETSGANQPTGVPLPNGSGIFTNGDFVFTIKVEGSFNSSQGVAF